MVAVTGSLQKRRADRRRNSKPGLLVWGPTESFAEGTPPWAGVPSDDSGFYATVTKTNDALRVRRHRPFVRDDDQRMPWRWSWSNNARISSPVAESRLPVGSSARTIDGSFTSARAIATRWRCPIDEWKLDIA